MVDEGSMLAALKMLTGRSADLGPRREVTRARIVKSATAQFLKHGYAKSTVDAIAEGAGVSRPTLYSYMKGKEPLLIAALCEEALGQLSVLEALFDETLPAEDRLRVWVREAILFVEHLPLTARVTADHDPEVFHILTEHELARAALGMDGRLDKGVLFAGLIEEAFPAAFNDLERSEWASVIRALSNMAPALADPNALFGLPLARMADLMADLVLEGLRGKADRSRA